MHLNPVPVTHHHSPRLFSLGLGAISAWRGWLSLPAALSVCLMSVPAVRAASPEVIDIGSRRELFVDDLLIDKISGGAGLRLHHPVSREIVLSHNAPWEGTGSGYHSIFKDGDLYRMYYKAWTVQLKDGKYTETNPLYTCYAESDDGIHWRKPELGIHEFNGSKANNIVMITGKIGHVHADAGHVAVFKDDNPDAPPDARYKAILRSNATGRNPQGIPKGLLPFKSSDGLHWSPMSDAPVITDGAFDSQNLAFWDAAHRVYRAYWRYFDEGTGIERTWLPPGVRAVRTATSRDFVTWENQEDLRYVDSPPEQLYTNQIKPYHRAPHLLLGFPARYVDRGWSDSMRALPEPEHREAVDKEVRRYGTAISEGLLMVSRDGVNFKRWNEAFLRPGPERAGTWNYGHQFMAWHVVETESSLDGAPNELSFYASESYCTPPAESTDLRRYTLRLDGFVSLQAPMTGGELLTKPLRFSGGKLLLNFSSSAAGDVRVELQDERGWPIPGFSLEECSPVFGDAINRPVTWRYGSDLAHLAGKTVKLRFVLRDADVYAFQFQL